ncbi:hypothetical protein ABIC80_004864, partial [Kosakonia sp. 1610]
EATLIIVFLMRLQNYQKVIAACKDTTSASGT